MSSIVLKGSHKNVHPLKTCDKCGKPSEPTNGVQMSQTKWCCIKCWKLIKK